jgi:hypothetical protein
LNALEAVLRHHDDKHEAILTFEASTRKMSPFVQFVGSSRTGLQLVFPLPRDKAEAQRAESFLKELGTQVEENNSYEDPYGEPTRRDRTFRKNFGKDAEPAAQITEQIFERVYQLPADFPLRVIDWEFDAWGASKGIPPTAIGHFKMASTRRGGWFGG